MFFLKPTELQRKIYKGVAAIVVAAILIESSSVGQWIFETGLIHMLAVLFALATMRLLISSDFTSDGSIRAYAHVVAIGMLATALAHVVEYFGDTMGYFGETVTVSILTGMYLAAGLSIAMGAYGFLRKAGVAPSGTVLAISTPAGVFVAITAAYFILDLFESETLELLQFVSMSVGLVVFLWVHRVIHQKIPMLRGFVSGVTISGVLVFASYSVEFFFAAFSRVGMSEGQIENFLHYILYLALMIAYLSFGALRALGGIYADIRAAKDTVV